LVSNRRARLLSGKNGIRGYPAVGRVERYRLVAGFVARFKRFERTSENRGAPGSSPGLAIVELDVAADFSFDGDRLTASRPRLLGRRPHGEPFDLFEADWPPARTQRQ
jgi:hypothetical protein